jgi:hypothetical protein
MSGGFVMKSYVALAAGISLGMLLAWTPSPARLVQTLAAQDVQHEQHQGTATTPGTTAPGPQSGMRGGNMMMGNMMASDAKLDELVKKMNDAKGQAKADATAEVVNALVQQHRAMRGMMAGRMGGTNTTPAQPGK